MPGVLALTINNKFILKLVMVTFSMAILGGCRLVPDKQRVSMTSCFLLSVLIWFPPPFLKAAASSETAQTILSAQAGL